MDLQNLPEPDFSAALPGSQLAAEAADDWFCAQVLPLEAALTRVLRRHWRHADDIPDMKQEIFMRVYEATLNHGAPLDTPAFVFSCARHLLVDRARRAKIISFDTVVTLEELPEQPEADFTPEQLVDARQKLNLLQVALDDLSPRCREVVILRKIDGLSHKEIAKRLGIAEGTIERHITLGVRALAETLFAQGVEAAATWIHRMRYEELDG